MGGRSLRSSWATSTSHLRCGAHRLPHANPNRAAWLQLRSPRVRVCAAQTAKIGSLLDVQESKDPEGLRIFYYLVQVLATCCGC